MTVGNLAGYLPVLVEALEGGGANQYLLLSSLKELISYHCDGDTGGGGGGASGGGKDDSDDGIMTLCVNEHQCINNNKRPTNKLVELNQSYLCAKPTRSPNPPPPPPSVEVFV